MSVFYLDEGKVDLKSVRPDGPILMQRTTLIKTSGKIKTLIVCLPGASFRHLQDPVIHEELTQMSQNQSQTKGRNRS